MIKIDVDTRCWKIPREEAFLGVESDDKVRILQFELSKNEFCNGLNFTDCNCFINYKNEGNDTIPYGITDMELQEDGTVTFTWEVSRGATIFKGNTFAILCAKKVSDDGTITNEWNSRIGSFTVSKGLEPLSSITEVPKIDIISQLLSVAQQTNTQSSSLLEKAEGLGYLKEEYDVLESRMNQFTSLKEGSTTGDAELTDIRVGADGKTYPNAGDAVRGQISELKGELVDINNGLFSTHLDWESGSYNAGGVKVDNVYSLRTEKQRFEKGDKIIISENSVINVYKYALSSNGSYVFAERETNISNTEYVFNPNASNVYYAITFNTNPVTTITDVTVADKSLKILSKSKIDEKNSRIESQLLKGTERIYPIWEGGAYNGSGVKVDNQYSMRTEILDIGNGVISVPDSVVVTLYEFNKSNVFVKRYTNITNTSVVISDYYNYAITYSANPVSELSDTNIPNIFVDIEKTIGWKEETDNINKILKESDYDYWKNKKIVWFGTSIPANPANGKTYPQIICDKLGATLYNEAVSSSCVRSGSHKHITSDDTMGWGGIHADSLFRSLSLSSAEKDELFNNWESKWKNIVWRGLNVQTPSASDIANFKNMSWDVKLAKYLSGGSVGQCDLYVFDHAHNDLVKGNDEIVGMPSALKYDLQEILDNPIDEYDRTYFFGAMNFILNKIYNDNPTATIMLMGHFENQIRPTVSQAQEKVAESWNLPLCKLWEQTGWSQHTFTTTYGWDNGNWVDLGVEQTVTLLYRHCADYIHPHTDKSGNSLKQIANIEYEFIKSKKKVQD